MASHISPFNLKVLQREVNHLQSDPLFSIAQVLRVEDIPMDLRTRSNGGGILLETSAPVTTCFNGKIVNFGRFQIAILARYERVWFCNYNRVILRAHCKVRALSPDRPYQPITGQAHPYSNDNSYCALFRNTARETRLQALCIGQSRYRVENAIQAGNWAEAALLVLAVLQEGGIGGYGYISIQRWTGYPRCHSCNESISSFRPWRCPSCRAVLCELCRRTCSKCGTPHSTCDRCTGRTCKECEKKFLKRRKMAKEKRIKAMARSKKKAYTSSHAHRN